MLGMGIIDSAEMKDASASFDAMFADGAKGNVHDEGGVYHGAGCRSSVGFLIQKGRLENLV